MNLNMALYTLADSKIHSFWKEGGGELVYMGKKKLLYLCGSVKN